MHSGLAKGMVIGGIIGASISMMINSDMIKPKTRKRMMKTGRTFFRKSGGIIGDVVDIFR
jgi:predicted small secreted protein